MDTDNKLRGPGVGKIVSLYQASSRELLSISSMLDVRRPEFAWNFTAGGTTTTRERPQFRRPAFSIIEEEFLCLPSVDDFSLTGRSDIDGEPLTARREAGAVQRPPANADKLNRVVETQLSVRAQSAYGECVYIHMYTNTLR